MDEIRITAEPKDNQTCNFRVDRPVYPDSSMYFGDAAQAAGSPLAEKIFAIGGVSSVLIQDSVVTVSASAGDDWMPIAKRRGRRLDGRTRISTRSGRDQEEGPGRSRH